jgi:muconate cycloisomerase
LEPLGVVVAEQPTHYADLEASVVVTRAVEMPVMADQLISTPTDALTVIRQGAADVANLKVFKGGLLATVQTRAVCEAGGLRYHLGSTASSRLLEAASLHFAVASPNAEFGCEIAEFADLNGDLAGPLEPRDGLLHLPDGPGFGVELLESAAV